MAEYTIDLDNEYIPEWDNNLERDDSEQIKIIWCYPSGSERASMTTIKSVDDRPEIEFNYDSLAKKCIKRVINLRVNGENITNGYSLAKTPGMDVLYQEVSMHIISKIQNREVDSKNS